MKNAIDYILTLYEQKLKEITIKKTIENKEQPLPKKETMYCEEGSGEWHIIGTISETIIDPASSSAPLG